MPSIGCEYYFNIDDMRLLYIGQYSEGTTSRMRAEALQRITSPAVFEVIDTHIPFYRCHPVWRSLAFRYKTGKVIWDTNRYILDQLAGQYDAIWVDKAVFLTKSTTERLKNSSNLLLHYTPDTAFKENRSHYFYRSLPLYDFIITTKSFDIPHYLDYITREQLIFIPQGYNKQLHYPRHTFREKEKHVVFIGLFEPSRAEAIRTLLRYDIPVLVAGKKWSSFVSRHQGSSLTYLGDRLLSDNYVRAISGAYFSLGLLSKRFPELHTTRTFEIPACGTALVTEHNKEISKFFTEEEVIYFQDYQDMAEKIQYYFKNESALEALTTRGVEKVRMGGYDYENQLSEICQSTGIISNT